MRKCFAEQKKCKQKGPLKTNWVPNQQLNSIRLGVAPSQQRKWRFRWILCYQGPPPEENSDIKVSCCILVSMRQESSTGPWVLFSKEKTLDLSKVVQITKQTKKRLRFSHKITFTIWHGTCIAGTLKAVPSWTASKPTHGGLTLQQDLKCEIEKKRNQQYCQERILVLMYGRLVAIAQLAVDKIYHFCATRIHIYIYVFNSILPCNKCLLLLYYQPPPFFPQAFSESHFLWIIIRFSPIQTPSCVRQFLIGLAWGSSHPLGAPWMSLGILHGLKSIGGILQITNIS